MKLNLTLVLISLALAACIKSGLSPSDCYGNGPPECEKFWTDSPNNRPLLKPARQYSDTPDQNKNTKSKNMAINSSSNGEIFPITQLKFKTNNSSVTPDSRNQQSKSIYESKDEIEKELASNNNGTSESRLRLFGQNGAGVVLYRDSKCIKPSLGKDDERVSGGLSSAFSSMFGTVSNTSIGMPETDTTRNLSKKNGLLSKAYFREYVIASNKPITVVMGFQDVSSFYNANGVHYSRISPSCKGAIQFVPHAGADYEASFSWSERGCELGMNRVSQKDGVTTLKPVKSFVASACDKN